MPRTALPCILLLNLACALLHTHAYAQEPVAMPSIGTRHVMVGVAVEPGVAFGEVENSRFEQGVSYAQMARLGIMQVVNRQLALGAGAQAGLQWIDEHGLAPQGRAPSERAFAFGFDLQAHWLFMGTLQGPSIGAGLKYHRAGFELAPAQVMSADLLVGWLLWTKDNQMVSLKAGYHFPIVQGLSVPEQFDETPANVAQWDWQRASLSISWSL